MLGTDDAKSLGALAEGRSCVPPNRIRAKMEGSFVTPGRNLNRRTRGDGMSGGAKHHRSLPGRSRGVYACIKIDKFDPYAVAGNVAARQSRLKRIAEDGDNACIVITSNVLWPSNPLRGGVLVRE